MVALVRVPPDGKLGPAMLKLHPRHRAFVCAVMELGPEAGNFERAAIAAGYDPITPGRTNSTGGGSKATRLAHDSDIQAAIQEETIRRIGSMLPMATAVMIDLLQAETTGAELKFKIANRLLALGGINPVVEQKITVTHTLSEAEKVDRIKLLAQGLGIDPQKLLGSSAGPIIDAEFEIVGSTEGLEDVL